MITLFKDRRAYTRNMGTLTCDYIMATNTIHGKIQKE